MFGLLVPLGCTFLGRMRCGRFLGCLLLLGSLGSLFLGCASRSPRRAHYVRAIPGCACVRSYFSQHEQKDRIPFTHEKNFFFDLRPELAPPSRWGYPLKPKRKAEKSGLVPEVRDLGQSPGRRVVLLSDSAEESHLSETCFERLKSKSHRKAPIRDKHGNLLKACNKKSAKNESASEAARQTWKESAE